MVDCTSVYILRNKKHLASSIQDTHEIFFINIANNSLFIDFILFSICVSRVSIHEETEIRILQIRNFLGVSMFRRFDVSNNPPPPYQEVAILACLQTGTFFTCQIIDFHSPEEVTPAKGVYSPFIIGFNLENIQ